MANDEIEFVISFPIWIIAISPEGNPNDYHGNFRCKGVLVSEFPSGDAIPIFTDEDILRRFIGETQLATEMSPVSFHQPYMLLTVLSAIEETGAVRRVAIDPWKGKTLWEMRIAHFVERLTAGLRRRQT